MAIETITHKFAMAGGEVGRTARFAVEPTLRWVCLAWRTFPAPPLNGDAR